MTWKTLTSQTVRVFSVFETDKLLFATGKAIRKTLNYYVYLLEGNFSPQELFTSQSFLA